MPSKIEITITTECAIKCTTGPCRCEIIVENTHYLAKILSTAESMAVLQRQLEAERQWRLLGFDQGKKKAS